MAVNRAETTIVEKKISSLNEWRSQVKRRNMDSVIGLVPTMGALHEGHEKLIEQACKECDQVIVTIFVNPTQFGPGEDLDKYPRTFESDLAMCKKHGVGLVFNPDVAEIYGDDSSRTTFVEPPNHLIDKLCGEFRPGHFRGVATVVSKLFNIAQADKAYFGEKDFQQLCVIKNMVKDLKIPVQVVGVPIVREASGLALSSRNTYLTEKEKEIAPQLNKALVELKDEFTKNKSLAQSKKSILAKLKDEHGFDVEYLEICDASTLEFIVEPVKPFVILAAAKLGKVRLIDNIIVR